MQQCTAGFPSLIHVFYPLYSRLSQVLPLDFMLPLDSFSFVPQDARDLYAKIKDSLDKEQWNAEDNEEYEDGEGNVLNRRTYEDLARQGLM